MADNRIGRRSVLAAAAALTLTAVAAPSFATTPATLASHRHPRTPDVITLPKGLRPEGITSGPGLRFYVGSLTDGRLVTGDFAVGRVRVLVPGAPGRSLRGLYYDARTGLIWAAGSIGAEARVWAFRGTTGAVAADVAVPGAVFFNDLAVAGDSVWVTDSRVDQLTRIPTRAGRPIGAKPRQLALGGDWPEGTGSAINANGIRVLPDGRLLLNNSRVGGLWAVDPRSGRTLPVPVRGGPGLTGGDGLELDGDVVYDVRGSGPNQVAALRLQCRHGGWQARWLGRLTDVTLDVPSTSTVAGRWLWAVNARFGVVAPETADYWISRLPALRC